MPSVLFPVQPLVTTHPEEEKCIGPMIPGIWGQARTKFVPCEMRQNQGKERERERERKEKRKRTDKKWRNKRY